VDVTHDPPRIGSSAEQGTQGGSVDLDKLVAILMDGHLWLVLGMAFVCGAVGALIHRGAVVGAPGAPPLDPPGGDGAEPRDNATPARRPSRLNDALTGGIAAVAILYVTDPTTGIALVGGSLVAGYAAKTILDGLEARIVSSIAQRQAAESQHAASVSLREAVDSKRQAEVATRNLESLVNHVTALPEPSPITALGTDHLAGIKQLARDIRAQLPLH
jgi:hypothetical protein